MLVEHPRTDEGYWESKTHARPDRPTEDAVYQAFFAGCRRDADVAGGGTTPQSPHVPVGGYRSENHELNTGRVQRAGKTDHT